MSDLNIVLFDDYTIRRDLLPFTFTRPTAKIRVGILTIEEKWTRALKQSASFLTETWLQEKYPLNESHDNLLINGALCPDDELAKAILQLEPGQSLVQQETVLASRQKNVQVPDGSGKTIQWTASTTIIDKVWKIFVNNGAQIRADFKVVTAGRKSAGVKDKHTIVYGEENLFVEEGVDMKACIINAEPGPVYLGKNSTLQEGVLIHGSLALCEGSHLNMGAKMRGDSTIGPYSKAGGEVSNSVIFGYSNKAHDGFLGNSVLGEWCNLGADTNTSNMKNNYDKVKLWSHAQNNFVSTNLQFCGLMMGDHSKCGINTMFNTGTVIDVSCNVFGDGFPRNYIPSFSWGGCGSFITYQLDKALATAERAMARRNVPFTDTDRKLLTKVFEITAGKRSE